MNLREFFSGSLLVILIATQFLFVGSIVLSQDEDEPEDTALVLNGAIWNVHDPVMIKHEDMYYIFSTGADIPIRQSTNMVDWLFAPTMNVFEEMPEEAGEYVPGADSIWAPDVSYFNDRYHIYYSVSTFGSSHSAIGLVTNTTLNSEDEDYEWVDHGIVVKSTRSSNYNAIDANLVLDTDNEPWLVFGSHWSGIKMIKIDYDTGKQSTEDETVYPIASRRIHPRAVEAPFIIFREGYYYLFVSFDQCCRGSGSTYNVRVGRSESITGPYVDREGVSMLEDGGTQITFPTVQFRGPGHNAIFSEDGQDYIVYHAYDRLKGGTPTLRIHPLAWDEEGWVSVPGLEEQADE